MNRRTAAAAVPSHRGHSTVVAHDRAIVCRDVIRIYASKGIEVQALQGLDLDIASGELVAIVGASGSGKSTLLGILSAHDRPTAGSATVAGLPVQALTRAQHLRYRRKVVGFVWQQTDRNLVPYLTIEENIHLALQLGQGDATPPRRRELVDLLEIGDVASRLPGDISGGQRQKAAIAVGLANEPAVLLADEPTGELDDATSAEVLQVLRRVNSELGTTTLIVTHDASVSEHVGRTIQIRDGRISSEVFRDEADIRQGTGGAREFTVVDSVGRMQLPRPFLDRLGIRGRARVELLDDHVGVYPERGRAVEGVGSSDSPSEEPTDA